MKYPFRYRYDSDDDVELDSGEEASGWDTPWPENFEREDEQEDEQEDEDAQEGHVSTTPDTPPTVSKGGNALPPQPQSLSCPLSSNVHRPSYLVLPRPCEIKTCSPTARKV